MRAATLPFALAVALALPSLAAGQVHFGTIVTYQGICEPSGAIGFPEGRVDQIFVVANDEDNILRAYRAAGGKPSDMPSGDLNEYLQLNGHEKADLAG